MSALSLNSIIKSYGISEVLSDFSLFLNQGEKVGLIGANGSGKTTVFKIISGMEPYISGKVALSRGLKLGYLSQLPDFNPDYTLEQEAKTTFNELIELEIRLRELEVLIADKSRDHHQKEPELQTIMQEYSGIQHRFEQDGGYQYESKIRQITTGMGFSLDELTGKRVASLSGGEKTRLGLVKLLLSEPDILLLDEPTNHLDLQAIQWLENYLKEYPGGVIIISHDRYFLDQIVDRIVELKNGRNEDYSGNYSYYLKERERRYEQLKHKYQNQQKKILKMEESIKRLYQWGQQGSDQKFFKRAQSMEKALDRIERVDKPVLDGKKMQLNFTVSNRSGREVLQISGVSKAFKDLKLFSAVNLNLYWGEKIAIIGKNGTGKTTLLKMITGIYPPDQGQLKLGANVRLGYYSQEFEGFNPQDDLITALCRECNMKTAEARNALAAFLFTEDEVFKKVGSLSGGEKSRLRLLQLMNGDYNFLILDEPTNHLDLPSRETLEETMGKYPGTILAVSHDRYFINRFIDYTYELEKGTLIKYHGNYDYYRRKKREEKEIKHETQLLKKETAKGSEYHRLKEKIKEERIKKSKINHLEIRIEETEQLVRELEAEMIKPQNLTKLDLLNDLKERYEKTQQELNNLYQEWEDSL